MRQLLLTLALLMMSTQTMAQTTAGTDAPLVRYSFDTLAPGGTVPNEGDPTLPGKAIGAAKIVPAGEDGANALSLDGVSACVEVPGTAGVHIGSEGFTILATVRFAGSSTGEGEPDTHDMILFKNQEFLFGRNRQQLYFNLHDGKGWAAGVTGGEIRPNDWNHAAVIVERIYEPPQGRVGYFIRLFLNGEMVGGREVLNYTSGTTEADINIGKGFGGPWYLRGEIAQVAAYPRAISDGELNRLLGQEKLAKVLVKQSAAADPRYPVLLTRTEAAVAVAPRQRARVLRQLLAAVTQCVNHADSQAALLPYLTTVERLAKTDEADPMKAFVKLHPAFEFLDNGRVSLAFFSPRPGATRLTSFFDLDAGREVLGEQRELWSLAYDFGGGPKGIRLDSAAASFVSTVTIDRANHTALLRWRHKPTTEQPFAGEVRSQLRLTGSRLSLNLAVDSKSTKVAVREVRFPELRLLRLDQRTDQLLVPRMSGVLHPNPIKTHFRYEGAYPSGTAHMQFFAYYDDTHGVYVACEDPKARSKSFLAGAAGEDCEIASVWFVGCKGEGGNGFRSSGDVAVELFTGDWFDASQLYKRFVRTAAWYPASRPRQDTPKWYRDLTVWFIGNANTPAATGALLKQRKALGLPVGLHWYGWNTEKFDDDYPHFTPREGFAQTVAQLQAEGVYVKPYINGRLWETKDRGDEDVYYTSVALPATLKDLSGQPYMEVYNKKSFSPMCPATAVWQQTMTDLCAKLAGDGVAAIYLDQISAARPRPCYDRTHPHVPGAGEVWLEQGYWPMLKSIRRKLRATNPNIVFNAEDAAEPYAHVLDGCLPWRFVDIGHVPAYQSIYAGRIQLTSRHFQDTSYEALFPKAAEQMLYGEQIGWFGTGQLEANPSFAVFVKKLAHTRRAFLPFFNEGDMLKPGQFARPAPTLTADWGFYGPRIITNPAVLHSVWRTGNSVAVLLANTTGEPVTVEFVPRAKAWGLKAEPLQALECHEGREPAAIAWPATKARTITVPAYGLAAWLFGDASTSEHSAHVTAARDLFASLRRFDEEAGMTPERKQEEVLKRNPWIIPEAPVRSASQWLEATSATKLVRAQASERGFVGWIADGGGVCFGAMDFGEAGGTPVIECEVAVPASTANGWLRVFTVADQQGTLLAEAPLKSTGDYQTYSTMRLPLPEDITGRHDVVIQVKGSGGGICNIKRWRLVREP